MLFICRPRGDFRLLEDRVEPTELLDSIPVYVHPNKMMYVHCVQSFVVDWQCTQQTTCSTGNWRWLFSGCNPTYVHIYVIVMLVFQWLSIPFL